MLNIKTATIDDITAICNGVEALCGEQALEAFLAALWSNTAILRSGM